MAFFNKKEDVIDIKLTPFGKHLVAKGQFQPVYYEFYDDDVIYDNQYSGLEKEIQGEIQKRIQETPKLKVQSTFESAERRMKEYKEGLRLYGKSQELILEKRNNFSIGSLPLANTAGNANNASSLSIKLMQGEVDSFNLLNSSGLPKTIKEINLKPSKCKIDIRKIGRYEEIKQIPETSQTELQIKQERVVVSKKDEYLLFDLKEFEVDYKNENFEIYLYELSTDAETGETTEKQLEFKKEYSNIIDGILYDADEREIEEVEENSKYAEYSLSILKDKEIPVEILCKYLSKEEIEKLNSVDGFNLDCEERIQDIESVDPLQERVDIEDC